MTQYEYRCETLPFLPGDHPRGPDGKPLVDGEGNPVRTTADVLGLFGAQGWRVVWAERVQLQPSRLNPQTFPALAVLLERRIAPEPDAGHPFGRKG